MLQEKVKSRGVYISGSSNMKQSPFELQWGLISVGDRVWYLGGTQ